jgi:hypothetical protein
MSVEDLKTTLASMSNGRIEDNEETPQKGVNNVYEKPDGRRPGTLDARWGDPPAEGHNGYPDVYGKAALEAAKDGRGDMIERLFDSPRTMAQVEQSLMAQNFVHARDGMPHSPMLQRNHLPLKEASVNESDLTLTDKVMRLAGRR